MAALLKPNISSQAEKELREQIKLEIEAKFKPCANPTYQCTIPRIDGQNYCIQHILRDTNANYRQCTFTFYNGKKCPNAVVKYDPRKEPGRTTQCFQHSRQAQLRKTRATIGRFRQKETNEAFLHNMSHHITVPESPKKQVYSEQEEEIDVVSPQVLPFISYQQNPDATKICSLKYKRRRKLDYASDSSGDGHEPNCFENTSRSHALEDSDNDSADSDRDDPLKHAGVYTREETVRIAEAKLSKLQGLYINQINKLNLTLKDKRRIYVQSLRKERETHCSIHDQVKSTPTERLHYAELKALNSYHRRHGEESLLFKKFKEKRARTCDGYIPKHPGIIKCSFTEGGVKCCYRVIPCCKHCRKHILMDKKQVLFRACGIERSNVVCQEAVSALNDVPCCVLHMTIPPVRQYTQKKYESETEDDDIEIKTESNKTENLAIKVEKVEPNDEVKPTISTPNKMSPQSKNDSFNVTIAHDEPTVAVTDSIPVVPPIIKSEPDFITEIKEEELQDI